jgi:alpha-glutamyl/putrescinyl thymine pyrophosphorylase clade 1
LEVVVISANKHPAKVKTAAIENIRLYLGLPQATVHTYIRSFLISMPSMKRKIGGLDASGGDGGNKKRMSKSKFKSKKSVRKPRSELKDYKCSLWSLCKADFAKSMKKNNSNKASKTIKAVLPSDLHPFIPNMVEFYLLMYERQCVFGGKKTSNPIMQNFHFCNNYRELDRGTAYFRSQILDLYDDLKVTTTKTQKRRGDASSSTTTATTTATASTVTRRQWIEQVLAMSYVYRMVNRIESFTNSDNPVGGIPRLGQFDDEFVAYVRSFKNNDSNTKGAFFTAAHQTTNYEKFIEWCQDATYKNTSVISNSTEQIIEAGNDLESICTLIVQSLKGVRDFFAWQIVCDLSEARCFGDDLNGDSFCLLGPGASSGLDDIFGSETNSKIRLKYTASQLCVYLRDSLDPCLRLVGLTFPYWRDRPCTLKIIEHALCEVNKFYRLDADSSNRLRKFNSRSTMDRNKPCQLCGCNVSSHDEKTVIVRCESCHAAFCTKCTSASSNKNIQRASTWCLRCKDFDHWCPV